MNYKQFYPKITVVVPIYNVEKYLLDCLESISKQTFKDIEVICVNDGSTDNSKKIIEEFTSKDSRFSMIDKINTGYGHSVNLGISSAKGAYIAIVESDDWIEPNMYEKMYQLALNNNADIVKCDFYLYDSYAKEKSVPYPHGTSDLRNVFSANKPFIVSDAPLILAYHSSVWASLYRADYIKSHKFIEDTGASYQDFPFMFKALLDAKCIVITYDRLLHYRMENSQSSSTKQPGRSALKIIDRILFVKHMLQEKGVLDKYAEEFYYHASKCTCGFFCTISNEIKPDFYNGMLKIYDNFPDKFTFKYFDNGLKKFLMLILHKKKGELFGEKHFDTNYKIKQIIKQFPSSLQRIIRKLYKIMVSK